MVTRKSQKEPQRYTILPKSSIQLSAESIGLEKLSDDVIEIVCQDVNYRLRELVQMSMDRAVRCKRAQLITADVNTSLQALGHEIIYGHTDLAESSLDFNYIAKENIYVNEDRTLDLFEVADSIIQPEYIVKMEGRNEGASERDESGVGEESMLVDGGVGETTATLSYTGNPYSFTRSWLQSEEAAGLSGVGPSEATLKELLTETLRAFLHDDVAIFKEAFHHVQSTHGINTILRPLLNSIPKLLAHLTCGHQRRRVMHLLSAIVTNPHTHLNYPLLLQKIVNILLAAALRTNDTNTRKSPVTSVDCDEIVFIFNIAATFMKRWSSAEYNIEAMLVVGLKAALTKAPHHSATPSSTTITSTIPSSTTITSTIPSSSTLQSTTILTTTPSPAILASAILGFNCLGVKVMMKHLLPLLLPLINMIQNKRPTNQTPSHAPPTKTPNHSLSQPLNGSYPLSQILLMTLRILMKWQVEAYELEEEEEGKDGTHKVQAETTRQISALYHKLVEMFADEVVAMLPEWEAEAEEKEVEVKLTDQDYFKTGEQLLEEMMSEGAGEIVKQERGVGSSDGTGMSVKTTFSKAHIKLTIAKKAIKSEAPEQGEGKMRRGVHASHRGDLDQLFQRTPLKCSDEALITFKFKAKNFLSTFLEKRKAMLLAKNMARQHASVSRYRQLCSTLPLHGKMPSKRL